MSASILHWPRQRARSLLRWARKQNDSGVLLRAQAVALRARGRPVVDIADIVGCARSHVYRSIARFSDSGREGLLDRRRHNGSPLADERFRETVASLLWQSPEDYDYPRPTWTRELLVRVAEEQTGIRVSVCTMGRVLRRLGARRGRPKPVVRCPLSDRQRRRRLRAIETLVDKLPQDEVAVYEDEVDIHFNPKVGLDWMPRGHQRHLLTPGVNQKAYLAGSLDARDGTVLWVGDCVKNSGLFVLILERLDAHYCDAKLIHVILDNYGIHKSHETQLALMRLPRIRLHFLPPYCPDHNRIERLWQDLHANVTRNHRHTDFVNLCLDVASYLDAVSPWLPGACPVWAQTRHRHDVAAPHG